jgi:hypothetical protein
MRTMRNERGMVMVVALGVMVALAAMSLAIARSGQMSTLTGALSAQTANAFYLADGAAYFALGDPSVFVPDNNVYTKDLSSGTTNMPSQAYIQFALYRSLPGNLLIRTTDGKVRAGQFGQNEGLGKMYFFNVDGVRSPTTVGVDPRSTVEMQAAKPGPCADCGS